MATEVKTTASAASKNKKKRASVKKKRKISKHILKANHDKEELLKARTTERVPLGGAEEPIDPPVVSHASKTSSKKKETANKNIESNNKSNNGASTSSNCHVKDIKEAAGYLNNWKQYRQQWKFNKNTQSWLIRHMYEPDKVTKHSFAILLEYLHGLKGEGAKERIIQDATRRALRYKKNSEEDNASSATKSDDNKQGNNDDDVGREGAKVVQFSNETKAATEEGKPKKAKTNKELADATEEEKRWNDLDDNDKRKEYKRARKILETLREPSKQKE